MKVNGVLKVVYDTEHVSEKFSRRRFILTIDPNGQYPQHCEFQLTQGKVSILDNIQKLPIGAEVDVHFSLRGREWNGPQGIKYFNTLEAWNVCLPGELESKGNTTQAATTTKANANTSSNNTDPEQTEGLGANSSDNEDLPF